MRCGEGRLRGDCCCGSGSGGGNGYGGDVEVGLLIRLFMAMSTLVRTGDTGPGG